MAVGASRQIKIGLALAEPLSRTADPVEFSAYRGLARAVRDLHVQGKTVEANQIVGAPFAYLARRHYDLVFALDFVPGLTQAARRFPHVRFVRLDATRGELGPEPQNVTETVFHAEQAAYLAGFAAARMADRGPAPHVVSSVGGIPTPQVQAYIAGFQAGAKQGDPKIRLLNAYTNDFVQPALCRHAALEEIARGSRAVFAVAGGCGIGALRAAKGKGIYGVGVDIDQSYLGKFILTSVLKNLNLAVYDLAKQLIHHRLRSGGTVSFDVHNHGVGLGKFSPVLPISLRRDLIPLARRIEKGKIVVPTTLRLSP
jgi:basic membrane protein A and related proteins